MKVGDLVIYMGHMGVILEPAKNAETICQHWHVWFFDSESYVIIYEPLMKKLDKNDLTLSDKQVSG